MGGPYTKGYSFSCAQELLLLASSGDYVMDRTRLSACKENNLPAALSLQPQTKGRNTKCPFTFVATPNLYLGPNSALEFFSSRLKPERCIALCVEKEEVVI